MENNNDQGFSKVFFVNNEAFEDRRTIKEKAKNFFDDHFPKPEYKKCSNCEAENCIHNESCIKCDHPY
jgi:hypothetical protein